MDADYLSKLPPEVLEHILLQLDLDDVRTPSAIACLNRSLRTKIDKDKITWRRVCHALSLNVPEEKSPREMFLEHINVYHALLHNQTGDNMVLRCYKSMEHLKFSHLKSTLGAFKLNEGEVFGSLSYPKWAINNYQDHFEICVRMEKDESFEESLLPRIQPGRV